MSEGQYQRAQERSEKQRQKELQRQLKEVAKLDELRRARLEVDIHENELAVLISIHRDCSPEMDWKSLAFALPPVASFFASPKHHHVFVLTTIEPTPAQDVTTQLEKAWAEDQDEYRRAFELYEADHELWARRKSLANRILAGDPTAYGIAVQEFSSFAEVANLGSAIEFRAHDSRRVSCVLSVNGQSIIPP